MIGLISALLLISAGLYVRLKQRKQTAGDFSTRWQADDLPKHEDEQKKKS